MGPINIFQNKDNLL